MRKNIYIIIKIWIKFSEFYNGLKRSVTFKSVLDEAVNIIIVLHVNHCNNLLSKPGARIWLVITSSNGVMVTILDFSFEAKHLQVFPDV